MRLINWLAVSALALLALALTACSSPPTSGWIEHKQYSAAYTYHTYPCILYTTIRTGTTSMTVCAAYGDDVWYRPAEYGLCLRHDKPNESDGCRDVTPQEYDRYREGQHYP